MKRLQSRAILLITLLITTTAAARDTITPKQPLANNETLVSSNGQYTLGFFTPAGSNNCYLSLWYSKDRSPTRKILWVANRDKPVTNSTGLLSMTSRGSLTITDSNSTVVWSANSTGLSNPIAQLLGTGNLVVREDGDDSGNYTWQGFNYPTNTLLAGMKVGVFRTTGLNVNLTSWKSDNDPSPGSYTVLVDPRGNPEIFVYSTAGSPYKVWRSGPWNGVEHSGSPGLDSSFISSFVNNDKEATFSYEMANNSIVSRLVMGVSGVLRWTFWESDANQWSNDYWYAPKDRCDYYGRCGPYGTCDPNSSPICKCLLDPAFMPVRVANGQLRDGKDGCFRNTDLNCTDAGTDDQFNKVSNVKLPESGNSTVDMSLSLDQCRAACLNNCSCTAYASADIRGSGSGCVIWVSDLLDIKLYVDGGQDLYVRVAAADIIASHSQSQNANRRTVAIIVSLISGALLLSCFIFFLWRRKKRGRVILGRTVFFSDKFDEDDKRKDIDLPLFNFGTIASATESFSNENKLGQGGFGPVYKGTLGGDKEIAVKRLAKSSQQGAEEFKNEVTLIAKLQNRNLVRLLGCCIQGEERMLIYEYMPNRSLDAFLFEKEKAALLEWRTRYQIIIGITRGLFYLHHDSRYRIIHRDLKASNILLDKEMNPKISDFGMARLFGGDETNYNTRKVVGTYGYMSPEYAMEGIFSVKSDVYSFGVLLLEIITGKKNRGFYALSPHLNLVAHTWSLWNEDGSLELVDEAMNNNFPPNDVLKCLKIGLLCVQDHPEDRPLMSSVIEMLGASVDITSLPHPKQPGFLTRRDPELDHILNNKDSRTSNELTATLDGR